MSPVPAYLVGITLPEHLIRQQSATMNSNYRSSLALNNMGVCLVELGCYQQAAETFADSISVIVHASSLHRVKLPPSLQGGSGNATVEERLRAAHQRLSEPSAAGSICRKLRVVQPINDKELASHHLASPSLRLASPIRFQAEDDERDQHYDFACMLYNAGTAFLCYADGALAHAHREKRRNKAMRLFQLAHAVLLEQYSSCYDRPMVFGRLLRTTALIVSTLHQVLAEGRVESERDLLASTTQRLARLSRLIQDLDQLSALSLGPPQVAAAA